MRPTLVTPRPGARRPLTGRPAAPLGDPGSADGRVGRGQATSQGSENWTRSSRAWNGAACPPWTKGKRRPPSTGSGPNSCEAAATWRRSCVGATAWEEGSSPLALCAAASRFTVASKRGSPRVARRHRVENDHEGGGTPGDEVETTPKLPTDAGSLLSRCQLRRFRGGFQFLAQTKHISSQLVYEGPPMCLEATPKFGRSRNTQPL